MSHITTSHLLRRLGVMSAALLLAALTGCATVKSPDPRDPWEPFNRSVFEFNDSVDRAVLKPVATVYRDVVPSMVRTGVGNFFGNMADAWSMVNNILQAKPEEALSSFWRVAVNSTMGLGGVLDPASEMQIQKNREDFGQTLGYWGVPTGPYLVLPLLGSSTLRDTAALPVDWYGYPLSHINDKVWMYSLTGLGIVDVRARLLDAGELLDTAALDPYTFRREAYLQRRANRVGDAEPVDEERYDLEPPATAAPPAPSGATPQRRRAAPPYNRQRPTPPLAPTSLAPALPAPDAALWAPGAMPSAASPAVIAVAPPAGAVVTTQPAVGAEAASPASVMALGQAVAAGEGARQ